MYKIFRDISNLYFFLGLNRLSMDDANDRAVLAADNELGFSAGGSAGFGKIGSLCLSTVTALGSRTGLFKALAFCLVIL